jgi:hypothetical protein
MLLGLFIGVNSFEEYFETLQKNSVHLSELFLYWAQQLDQWGLKLNGTHQLLVYVDDVNLLGGIVHAIRKNTEALVVASIEILTENNNVKGH